MDHRSAFLQGLAFIGAGMLLASCSGWSANPPIHGNPITENWTHPEIDAMAPQGSNYAQLSANQYIAGGGSGTFDQHLAHDYAGYADLLSRESPRGDWVDVDYFSRKGMAAAQGQVVPPEENSNWAIPLEYPLGLRTHAAQVRTRLVADLDAGGRERFPALAARAQVDYDCWLERMEDNWQTAQNGRCYTDLMTALDLMERRPQAAAAAAPTELHQFNVYFEFDKSSLTPEARRVVDTVASDAKSDPTVHIRLVGKADLTGTDAYNMALSHRRADTVRRTLVSDGIQADRIEEHWDGFRDPPVPTPMGVREPRNRVVEIRLNNEVASAQ